jgi:hypothetical protein
MEKAINAAKAAGKWGGSGPDQSIGQWIDWNAEVYTVRDAVWKKAGLEPMGGCLCIGCLEKRIGRKLKPKDFDDSPLNKTRGTARLLKRRGDFAEALRAGARWNRD